MKSMRSTIRLRLLSGLAFLLLCGQASAQYQSGYLTQNGAWCWFSDPRAIVVDNHVLTGWVKSGGTVEAARFNLSTDSIETAELYYSLEADDHNNPAFVQTGQQDILALYTRHSKRDLFINRQIHDETCFKFGDAQFIRPISEEELNKFPRRTITYANPYRLEAEDNRIYCFGRWTGFKPNIMWSDDNGSTWTKSRVFITNHPFDSGNRPYVKYFSDGRSRIHMVFTDGHPRVEPTNSVYYACYVKGAFYKASGEMICTMDQIPFEPKDASVVYTSNPEEGRAWIADIGQDRQGHPVLLYTRSPTENNHEYWYARHTDQGWINRKICDSGKWFPQTPEGKREPEPHYFGGMTVHPDNADMVCLSRQIDGVFEIECWTTEDMGATWQSEPVTRNSQSDNVRPYIPRGLAADAPLAVFWMEVEKYVHYTNFKTAMRYAVRH